MRWFVVFLLLANLVLYLWLAYGESPRPANDLPPPDIGRLPLLHEAEPTALAEPIEPDAPATQAAADEAGSPDWGSNEDNPDSPMDTAGVSAASRDTSVASSPVASPSAGDAAATIDPVAESGGPSGQPVAADLRMPGANAADEASGETPPAAPAIDTAGLEQPAAASEPFDQAVLSTPVPEAPEATSASRPAVALSLPDAVPEAAPAAEPLATSARSVAVNRCLRIGPLTIAQVQALRAGIEPAVSVVDEQRRETTVVDGYYVLIPPLASRQEGNRKLDELSAAGVTDTWLFRSGALRNAISLGYFKRETSALRHAETIRGLGFDAEVREKPVQVERSWLLVSRPADVDAAVLVDAAPEDAAVDDVQCPAR